MRDKNDRVANFNFFDCDRFQGGDILHLRRGMLLSIKEFYNSLWASVRLNPIEVVKQQRRLLLIESMLSESPRHTIFVGCGMGDEISLVTSGESVGIDTSRVALAAAKKNHPFAMFVLADAHHLPLRAGTADQVVLSETLEHLVWPERSISEILRICEGDAKFVLTTPNWFSLWGVARKIAQFVLRKRLTAAYQPIDNWYTIYSLKRLLESRFRIISTRGAWYFPPLGRGNAAIKSEKLAQIMKRMILCDVHLGKVFPYFGHFLGMVSTPYISAES